MAVARHTNSHPHESFPAFYGWYALYVKGYAKMLAPVNDAPKGMCITQAQKRAQKFEKKFGQLVGADGATWIKSTVPVPHHPYYHENCKAVGKTC